jgi:CBS domain containing-hemolysin-like protein
VDVVFIVVGVLVSGLCEFLTAALGNLPVSIISVMAEDGSAAGRRLRRALDDPDAARVAVSTLDVVVLLMIAAAVAVLDGNQGSRLGVFVSLLVLGVVTTKMIMGVLGTRYAQHMLAFTASVYRVLSIITKPLIWVQRWLLRITQASSNEEEAREELEALVETARDEGALDAGEYRIMSNIMQLSSIEVEDVMTPRTVVFGMPETTTVADAVKQSELQMYSRFPVCEGADLDSVSGYVMTKDVLRAALAGRHHVALSKLKRDVHFIPENITLERALEQFLQLRQHVFMVVDEYGGVEGLLTMEDVLETMLGAEIVDEADRIVDLRALAKQRRDARVARAD